MGAPAGRRGPRGGRDGGDVDEGANRELAGTARGDDAAVPREASWTGGRSCSKWTARTWLPETAVRGRSEVWGSAGGGTWGNSAPGAPPRSRRRGRRGARRS